MKKFKVPIIYGKVDRQGDIFDKKALKQIVEQTKLPVPIHLNFDLKTFPIGQAICLEEENNSIVATIELRVGEYPDDFLKNYCFRVCGASTAIKNPEGVTVINDFELLSIGMISKAKDVYDEEDK